MIFVTVGTHPQSFNRLLKAIDELVERGKIKEKVVMQIGHST
jgi:UDP-N-acetylglucosamine transferase subunit ALG13